LVHMHRHIFYEIWDNLTFWAEWKDAFICHFLQGCYRELYASYYHYDKSMIRVYPFMWMSIILESCSRKLKNPSMVYYLRCSVVSECSYELYNLQEQGKTTQWVIQSHLGLSLKGIKNVLTSEGF